MVNETGATCNCLELKSEDSGRPENINILNGGS